MPRLPTADGRPSDYSRLTFQLWEGLNGKYAFYIERWRRTLDFLRDQHWQTLKAIDESTLPDWRRFPLQNYTLAFYNDYLTDYLKSEVRFSAVPTSDDPQDIDAAELAEQVLKYLWGRMGFDRKRIDLGAWVMACGTGVLRIYWDTNTGNQVPIGVPTPDGGFIPFDPATMQPHVGEPIMVDAGEIGVEVVSPQFVRWAESPSYGVMVGLLLTFEEVETFYGTDVADKLSYSADHHGISADLNQIQQPGITPITTERALLIEHYLPRSARNPQGLWWTSANNGSTMIHNPWPLPGGRIPLVSFRWIPLPGERHIGVSPLYGMTFQNKIYEEMMAKVLEWYAKAKPKRLLKSGGGIAAGDFTDEPFQEVVVHAGAEPQNLEVQEAPRGLFQIMQTIQSDMSITSGRAFEGQDELPEGLATTRIRAPAEMKTSKAITTAHYSAKPAWHEVGEILMHYVGEFYTEPRVVAIQGPDKSFTWRTYMGEKLIKGNDLAATLIVDDIPLFPQNRQNLRDTVVALLQTQAGQILFAGPDGQIDMERVKGALQATGLDVNLSYIDPDVLEAKNEQVEFQNGGGPQLQSWQNHLVHYDEHTRILKSMRFRAWPPEAREAFLAHVQEHEQALNQQAQEEAQAMVEQEQQLRRVREQEELRADVMKEWAVAVINLVAETTGLEVQDVMGLLERAPKSSQT
jgi:hypothetical protein